MDDASLDSPARAAAPLSSTPGRKPRRDDLLEVDVEGYAAGGGVLGRVANASGTFRVELRRGVPGERTRVRVLRRRGHDLRARAEAVLRVSPHAVSPRCAHVPECGGCTHQDLDYSRQLEQKRAVAERVLRGAGLCLAADAPPVEACLPCQPPWRFRNKMDFTFAPRRYVQSCEPADAERDFALGLHPSGHFDKVVDVTRCEITFEQSDAIVADARALARERRLDTWDIRTQAGLLRHLVLRRSHARGEILVNLVTSEEAPERVLPYVRELCARHPEITTLVQTINRGVAKTALGERELVHVGDGTIVEELGGFSFRLSARSFFQTNTPQAERLLECVLAEARAGPSEVVYDLYCGAGALTLSLAGRAGSALGFELVAESVADARANAERNGVTNASFVAGDVADALQACDLPEPDVVVVDPPRSGMHPRVVDALGLCRARRVVYVTCNLKSAARDCVALSERGLRLTRVQPVDLFPHTPHLESVLTLEREA